MKLKHGLHLAYCANVHRGETWRDIFDSLQNHTLAVRERVCAGRPYAIGLRLSNRAAHELNDPPTFLAFRKWLDQHQCYVFTIDGFSYGRFHGERIKEQVYLPDWISPERLAYTNLLFDLLARLLPKGVDGSVSTVPGSFKGFVRTPDELKMIRTNLWRCVEHTARVSELTERKLHLALEPEPLGLLECSAETLHFFERLRTDHRNDPRLAAHLGVNYDTCHFAVEFEEPQNALGVLQQHGIRISKLHLSNALKVRPTPEARAALAAFKTDVYLHQVVVRRADGQRVIYSDLDDALATEPPMTDTPAGTASIEWRIHFHIPLHSPPLPPLENTRDHLTGALDWLMVRPTLCSHLEMKTHTWEMQSEELKNRSVVEQLIGEYDWTLARLAERGLGPEE